MSKFKVGDKVKVVSGKNLTGCDGVKLHVPYTVTTKSVAEEYDSYGDQKGLVINWHSEEAMLFLISEDKKICYVINSNADVELVTPQLPKIVIAPKKNGKVSAVLFNGDTYIKHATAKCSPDDTYDFNIGAKLAFNRLMGIEDKPQEQPLYKEVKRHANVGEYIKIVDIGNHGPELSIGDIHKVIERDNTDNSVRTDKKNWLLDEGHEYVVLENYNPNSADTFDWEKFKKGEIAVKCPTEELAINFLTECDKRKIKWVNERNATSETNFYSYKEKTYYGFGFGCLGYGSIERECFKEHYKSSIEWTTNGAVIPQKLDLSHVTNEELIAELTKRLEQ